MVWQMHRGERGSISFSAPSCPSTIGFGVTQSRMDIDDFLESFRGYIVTTLSIFISN